VLCIFLDIIKGARSRLETGISRIDGLLINEHP
jgi:hypothetical protein